MSQKLIDVVNEENVFKKHNTDFNNVLLMYNPKQKCGEVFLGHEGNFTLVCSLCQQRCSNLLNFGEHIRDVHSLTEDEARIWNARQDDTIPEKKEPPAKADGHNVDEADDILQDTNDFTFSADDAHTEESDQSEEELFEWEAKAKCSKRSVRSTSDCKTYCCFSCGKVFVTFVPYRNHYRNEHPDMIEMDDPSVTELGDDTTFVTKAPDEMLCKYCLETFDDPATYHVHMANAHPSPKLYSCPHCPTKFSDKNGRTYHLGIHEGKRPYKCEQCPKAFSHPNNLQTHINSCHLNLKPFECQFCEMKFGQKSTLKVHERTHTNERPYQCDECGMSFIAQVRLTYHMRRHKNIRNYKCSFCGKAFFNSRTLNTHIRTHTKETPFSCDICGQKFTAQAAFRSHKMLHSGVKRYVCKLCGKGFAQGPGLYSHMKSHREIEK